MPVLVSSPDFCSAPSLLLLVVVCGTFGGHALCRCLLAVQTFALHHLHFLLLCVEHLVVMHYTGAC